MSVSDPLIKELKGHVTKLLFNCPKPITDQDPNVSGFCECFEKILYKNLIVQKNIIGILRTPQCWSWLKQLSNEKADCPYSYISCVENVKRCEKVTTSLGRVRLLIRNALVRRCTHVPIQILILSDYRNTIYSISSIIGDEILSQLLLSVLLLVSKLEFKLDLDNASFLDITWNLPKAVPLQVVPCSSLGLSIMFINKKALIINVLQDSVASESNTIMIGDILDTLNGVVINDNLQGSVANLLRKSVGQPVSLYIVKGVLNDEIYPPILPFLGQAEIDPVLVLNQYRKETELMNNAGDADSKITFIGCVDSGDRNDVKQIFIAINSILKAKSSEDMNVLIECHDLGIKVINSINNEVLFEHAYMEISSCGCSTTSPYYFAYIAREKVISLSKKEQILIGFENADKNEFQNNGCFINYADDSFCKTKKFKCFIFHSHNRPQIDTLLRTIGQGFRRTLYTV